MGKIAIVQFDLDRAQEILDKPDEFIRAMRILLIFPETILRGGGALPGGRLSQCLIIVTR